MGVSQTHLGLKSDQTPIGFIRFSLHDGLALISLRQMFFSVPVLRSYSSCLLCFTQKQLRCFADDITLDENEQQLADCKIAV